MEDRRLRRHRGQSSVASGNTWALLDVHFQVSEDLVLNDASGLHLSAGPYFLIYSAALTEEQENAPIPWPEELKVRHIPHYMF